MSGLTGSGPFVIGVLLQAEPEIDPNIVRPGWTPLLITVLLLVALVFLFFSMRKQMRKIRTPDDIEAERRAAEEAEADASAPEARRSARPDSGVDLRSEVRSELGPDVRAEPRPEQAQPADPHPEPREPKP